MTSKANGGAKGKCVILTVKQWFDLMKKVESGVSMAWVCKKQCLISVQARTLTDS